MFTLIYNIERGESPKISKEFIMGNQENIQRIKNYFASPKVLIEAVALFLSVLCSMCTFIPLYNFIEEIVDEAQVTYKQEYLYDNYFYDDYDDFDDYYYHRYDDDFDFGMFKESMSISTLFSGGFSFIISLVPIFAWAYIFFASRSSNLRTTPKAGFIILFIIFILGSISGGLSVLLGGLFSFIGLISAGSYDSDIAFLGIVMLITFGVVFFVGIVNLLYNIFGAKFFHSVNKSLNSPNMIISGKSYGIMSIVNAVVNVLFSIGIIVMGIIFIATGTIPDISGTDEFYEIIFENLGYIFIITGVSGLINAAACIIQGIIAFGYNKMAENAPVNYDSYGVPGYNNIPPYGSNVYYNNGYNNNYGSPIPPFNQQYNQPYNQQYNNQFNNATQQPVYQENVPSMDNQTPTQNQPAYQQTAQEAPASDTTQTEQNSDYDFGGNPYEK